MQFVFPINTCLLNTNCIPDTLLGTWEVKILVLGYLSEHLRVKKRALKHFEGSGQWLWALVSISGKEQG